MSTPFISQKICYSFSAHDVNLRGVRGLIMLIPLISRVRHDVFISFSVMVDYDNLRVGKRSFCFREYEWDHEEDLFHLFHL